MRQAFDCRSEVGHGEFQSRELGLVEKLTGIADGARLSNAFFVSSRPVLIKCAAAHYRAHAPEAKIAAFLSRRIGAWAQTDPKLNDDDGDAPRIALFFK
eukprot:scaffold1830_cov117-Cylindrotheca_fusiformis.AAC.25